MSILLKRLFLVHGLGLFLFSCGHITHNQDEKIYIVQRERESLQIISSNKIDKIEDLGNLNHATMKFKWGNGYLLARNGFLSKIDIENDKLIKKVKIGKSGIGLTFTHEHIVIVNYDPSSVVILDKNLEIIKTISTDSRNVGVKVYKNLLVFSLMDKNEIWILDTNDHYNLVKKIENVGNLPFDALINENNYLVGFFNEPTIGFLDLENFSYKRISLTNNDANVVYKVPHFGYWGIVNDFAFVPMAAQRKILVIDLKQKVAIKEIELKGEPVFASVSLDKKQIVVNYSGENENFLSVINTDKKSIEHTFEAGKRVMHLRFSTNGEKLYVTSYFENKMHEFQVNKWKKLNSVDVATPSGVFLNTIME